MAEAKIGVGMEVTNLAKFKSDMAASGESVKTLTSKLKENEAQYKATGDSETYMANKTKLLQQQIQEQQKIVDTAKQALEYMQKQGVDPASKSYQDMERRLADANTKLYEMKGAAKTAGDALDSGADKAGEMDAAARHIGDNVSYENLIQAVNKVTGAMEAGAKKAWEFAQEAYRASVDASQWADDLLTEATQNGIDVETLQKWRYAERFIDTEAKTMENSFIKLTSSMKTIGNGTDDTQTAFDQLGVVVRDTATGELRDSQQVFWECITALGRMGDSTEADAAAMTVFGKSFRELKPLIEAGTAEFERVAGQAPILSEEAVKSLGTLNDQVQELDAQWQTLQMELWSALAPTMTEVAGAMTEFVAGWREWAQSKEGQEMLSKINEILQSLIGKIRTHIPKALEKTKQAAETLSNVLQWVLDNGDTVKRILEGLVATYGALKIGGGVLKFLQLVKSIQWLNVSRGLNDLAKATSGGNGTGIPTTSTLSNSPKPTAGGAVPGGLGFSYMLKEAIAGSIPTALIASLWALGNAHDRAVAKETEDDILPIAQEVNDLYQNAGEALDSGTAAARAELQKMADTLTYREARTGSWLDIFAFDKRTTFEEYQQGLLEIQDLITNWSGDVDFSKVLSEEDLQRLRDYKELTDLIVKEQAGDITDAEVERLEQLEAAGAGLDQQQVRDIYERVYKELGEYLIEMGKENGLQVDAGTVEGMKEGQDDVNKAAGDVGDGAISSLEDASGVQSPSIYGHDIGYNIDLGLANGILDGRSEVLNAAAQVAAETIERLRQDLQINSPSKVMFELGGYVSQGFAEGIEDSVSMVRSAVGGMTRATTRGIRTGGGDSQTAMARMLANALSKATVAIDGQAAGAVLAPTVDQILGAAFSRR